MKKFRTLRGFVEGAEPVEETGFEFSASLRICGSILDLEAISRRLGLQPTHLHRNGQARGNGVPPWSHDMWCYEPELPESEPLDRHITCLWSALKPNKKYLLALRKQRTLTFFLVIDLIATMPGLRSPIRLWTCSESLRFHSVCPSLFYEFRPIWILQWTRRRVSFWLVASQAARATDQRLWMRLAIS
jgi:hypothetical protein